MGGMAPAGKPKRPIRQQWAGSGRSMIFSNNMPHYLKKQKPASPLQNMVYPSSVRYANILLQSWRLLAGWTVWVQTNSKNSSLVSPACWMIAASVPFGRSRL
jgi:hypothetical protein